MQKFLEEVDAKTQEEMEEMIDGERDKVTPLGCLLDSLILRAQEKRIFLEAEIEGRKEELMITHYGIYFPNPGGITEWTMIAEINPGNRVKMESLVNSPSSTVNRILKKALDRKVSIKVRSCSFYVKK